MVYAVLTERCTPLRSGPRRLDQACPQYRTIGDYMSSPKILAPVDGSPASIRAVDFAIKMLGQNAGTSLVLVHVSNVPAIELAGTEAVQELASERSARALKDATEKCEAGSADFKTLVRTGQTAKVRHIVIGTRSLGGVQGLLLGSVATQVIHLADVPITLIK